MDNKIKSLLGLLDGGKRIYRVADGEVDADQFEYCAVLNQVLFGPKGLVDTLGPTWEMVHDPRFEKIENLFVINKQGMFGGDARQGLQVQTADGTFTGGFSGLQQYAEMLGEGRYLIGVLKNFAIVEVLNAQFPDRQFKANANDSHAMVKMVHHAYPLSLQADLANTIYNNTSDPTPEQYKALNETAIEELWALALSLGIATDFFIRKGVLAPDEREAVKVAAEAYDQYKPHSVEHWDDERIWSLLKLEYTNYFSRKGKPNQDAKTLFAIVKGGLLGLVADFAKIANVQETVLLDDPNTLYEPEKHGEEAPRVFMEVDLLERALSYRAELRVTAAQILSSLGIGNRLVELTDLERDHLLKIVYTSKWPLEKTEMILKVLSYANSIRFSGLSVEERRFKQLTEASITAQKHVAGLNDGSIQPINRYTDGIAETSVDDNEKIMERILGNPLLGHLFLRFSNLESRIAQAEADYLTPYCNLPAADLYRLLISPGGRLEELEQEFPDFKAQRELIADYKTYPDQAGPPDAIVSTTDAQFQQILEIRRLAAAAAVLSPAFATLDYELTEEKALELFAQVEEIDPTPKPETAQYEGELDESKRIDPTPTIQ